MPGTITPAWRRRMVCRQRVSIQRQKQHYLLPCPSNSRIETCEQAALGSVLLPFGPTVRHRALAGAHRKSRRHVAATPLLRHRYLPCPAAEYSRPCPLLPRASVCVPQQLGEAHSLTLPLALAACTTAAAPAQCGTGARRAAMRTGGCTGASAAACRQQLHLLLGRRSMPLQGRKPDHFFVVCTSYPLEGALSFHSL